MKNNIPIDNGLKVYCVMASIILIVLGVLFAGACIGAVAHDCGEYHGIKTRLPG